MGLFWKSGHLLWRLGHLAWCCCTGTVACSTCAAGTTPNTIRLVVTGIELQTACEAQLFFPAQISGYFVTPTLTVTVDLPSGATGTFAGDCAWELATCGDIEAIQHNNDQCNADVNESGDPMPDTSTHQLVYFVQRYSVPTPGWEICIFVGDGSLTDCPPTDGALAGVGLFHAFVPDASCDDEIDGIANDYTDFSHPDGSGGLTYYGADCNSLTTSGTIVMGKNGTVDLIPQGPFA